MISIVLYILTAVIFVLLCSMPIYLFVRYLYAGYKDMKEYNKQLKKSNTN